MSILAFKDFQSSVEAFNVSRSCLASGSFKKPGKRFFILGARLFAAGMWLILPCFRWYLRKDFRDEIFRLIDLDVIFRSFRVAIQLRIKLWLISASLFVPNCFCR